MSTKMQMRQFGDFEDAAMKSWQSFSTMKRFVSEGGRLKYASWRLWYMQKQQAPPSTASYDHSPSIGPLRPPSTLASTTTTTAPTDPSTLPSTTTTTYQSTTTTTSSSSPKSPTQGEFTEAYLPPPRRRTPCVYCEQHVASLSCHGCCHDEYCVACFKLVHKKGHLATHTAVKLKDLSVGGGASFSSGSSMGRSLGNDAGQMVAPISTPNAAVAMTVSTVSENGVAGSENDKSANGPTATSTAGSSPTSSQSGYNSTSEKASAMALPMETARTKSWELQLDTLLQRLMINTVHRDNDISVHNIDECESLGTESVVSYPYLSDSEDQSGHYDYAVARLQEQTIEEDDDTDVEEMTSLADTVDLRSTNTSSALKAAASALNAVMRPQSPAASPLLRPASDAQDVPPLMNPPATLVRTKSRRKNLVCANCNGNHITIDCPQLESSLPAGQSGVGTVLRKCFTTLHNDNLSDSTHAFLGDEVSVRGGSNFSKPTTLSVPERIAKGASAWTTFGMSSISEDQTVDVHDTLPVLASLQPNPEGSHVWNSTSWLMTALATELPLDVFETLRKAERDPANKSAFDSDPSMSGWIFLRQHGSKWCKRYVSLLRNNMWEYLDDRDSTRPIGHANVGEGIVSVVPSNNTTLVLEYYQDSSPDAARVECLIRCETASEAEAWRNALMRATKLSVDDLFDRTPGSPDSPVAMQHELGKGRFAKVSRARRNSLNADFCNGLLDCALKIIDKRTFWSLVSRDTERDDTVVREILTQTVLTVRAGASFSPVIRLLSVFETRNELVMELELMREGDLHEEIVANAAVNESRASYLVASMVCAIDFCQHNGIAHRDVKLSNLALDYCTSPTGERLSVIKIADFGMASFVRPEGTLKGRCGTPGFVAPEILTAGKGEAYPATVDMFSVGVVTYTMLCGYEPFFGVNDEELIQMNKAAEYDFEEPEWDSISEEAKDLITMMMEKDPIKRITPKEALDHPFVQEANVQLNQLLRAESTVTPLRLL